MHPSDDPFDSLESAQSFLALLYETIAESKQDIEADLHREHPQRRLQTLRLAHYNLIKLEEHLRRCKRITNDLRTIRRLLFDERSHAAVITLSTPPAIAPSSAKSRNGGKRVAAA